MELAKIVLVSLSIAVASATPHGYGVKGGAAARSGAFSGALGLPGGGAGGYGGSASFSQSSASSYASSNSGSFSYSGPAGVGGYGGGGAPVAPGTAGAGSAAFASAGAVAGSGGYGNPGSISGQSAPCSGNCPNNQDNGCTGNNCRANVEPPKCSSGSCDGVPSTPVSQDYGPTPEKNTKPTEEGPLLGHIALDTDDRPGKIEGTEPHYYSTASNHRSPQPGSPCSSPDCGQSVYNKPPPCSTPGCGQDATSGPACSSPGGCRPDSGPSSSNNYIPYHNSVSPCASPGGCSQPGESSPSAPTTTFANEGPSCSSPGGCGSSGGSGAPHGNTNAFSLAGASAVAGSYGGAPVHSPGNTRMPIVNSQPGYTSNIQYSGSFGGPQGILKPNDYSVPEKQVISPDHGVSSYGPGGPSSPHGLSPSSQPVQGTPSVPPSPIYSGQSSYGLHKNPKPHDVSGLPSFPGAGAFAGVHTAAYTGGFGGPPGILRPNDFSLHSSKPFNKPQGQNQIKPIHHEPAPNQLPVQNEGSYQGNFGGPPGVVRPNGPIGTGTFPTAQPQPQKPDYPSKPSYGCGFGPGSSCGGSSAPVHPIEIISNAPHPAHNIHPNPGCGPNGCGNGVQYEGGFGGPPGILRPSGYSSEPQITSNNYQPIHNHPQEGSPSYHGGHSGAPSTSAAGAGAFAAATASAGAGSYSGQGAPGYAQGGYTGKGGSEYGVEGQYSGTKPIGQSQGCGGGCGGQQSGAGANAYSGAFGLGLGGGSGPLTAAKQVASSFSQIGQNIGKNIGGLFGLGGGGNGGGAAGGPGALSVSGSFATASANSGAKSYGGY